MLTSTSHSFLISNKKITFLIFFFMFFKCLTAQAENTVMADYYWVGGSGNWSDLSHWATTSGGNISPATVPQSTNNIYFDANSGFTPGNNVVTIDETIVFCKDMDWTGAVNAPELAGPNENTLIIFGSLKFIPDLQLTFQGEVHFSSSNVDNIIETNGIAFLYDIFFDGLGGEWILQDDLNVTTKIHHSFGTLNTNDNDVFANYFYSVNPGTRKLTLGSSTINLSGSYITIPQPANSSFSYAFYAQGLTVEEGTSHFIIDHPGEIFVGGGETFYDISFVNTSYFSFNSTLNTNVSNKLIFKNGGNINSDIWGAYDNAFGEVIFENNGFFYGNNSFDKITCTPGHEYQILSGSTQSINTNGNLNINGNCNAIITLRSTQAGQQAFLMKTSGTENISYVALQDINAFGGADFNTSNSIDIANNSGWNFMDPASRTLFWIGGSGNWDDQNHWSLTSGGTGGECPPTPFDDVFFDLNSGLNSTSDIVNINVGIAFCNDMIWDGISNNPSLDGAFPSKLFIFGSLKFSSDMVLGFSGETHFMAFDLNNTITTNGIVFLYDVFFDGLGGEWILQDDLNVTTKIHHSFGTLNTNDNDVFANYFYSVNPGTRKLTLGSSTINLSGSYITIPQPASSSFSYAFHAQGLTLEEGTSHFIIDHPGEIFVGGGETFYDISFVNTSYFSFNSTLNTNVSNKLIFKNGGNINSDIWGAYDNAFGEVIFENNGFFYGNNSFDKITCTPGHEYQIQGGSTQSINTNGNLNIDGNCNAIITLRSTQAGLQASFMKTSGTENISYVALQDINAFGGADFNTSNSIDIANNSGWNFMDPASRTLFWIGGSGNWDDQNHWSLTSGGTGGECPPTPFDDVFFDLNSGLNSTSDIVNINVGIAFCNDMIWDGISNNPSLDGAFPSKLFIFGSLEFSSNMVLGFSGETHFMAFDLNNTITTNGIVFLYDVFFDGLGGEWILQDDLNVTTKIHHSFGTLNTNDNDVFANYFYSVNPGTRKLTLGSSTINLSGSYITIPQPASSSFSYAFHAQGLTLEEGTSHFTIGHPGEIFVGGGETFYDISFVNTSYFSFNSTLNTNVSNKLIFKNGGNINSDIWGAYDNTFGEVIFENNGFFYGNNSFDKITFSPGKTYILRANQTQTITALGDFDAQGNGSFPIEFKSSQSGLQATLHKDGDPICLDYLFMSDIAGTGTAFGYAGDNSDDVINNSGWIFGGCPTCFSAAPAPAPTLDPSSNTNVFSGSPTTLILSNLQTDEEAVWFDETQETELYSDVTNNFQFVPTTDTTLYAALRNLNTGCISDLLPVALTIMATSPEVCDGMDNDGDGLVDEGFDLDGDGFTTCQNDCDDNDASVNPNASELCDGIDNNCDGVIDEVGPCPLGLVTILNQQDLNDYISNYSGCNILPGNLVIGPSSDIINLTGLECIEEIQGGLFIENNLALTDMSALSGLIAVGSYIRIQDNPILLEINLQNIGGSINNLFEVNDNAALTTFDGPINMNAIGQSLRIFSNPNLSTFTGFENINSIGGNIILSDILEDNFPDFSNLTNVGTTILIDYNPNVTQLNLQNVTGTLSNNFYVQYNPSLVTLNAPMTLTSVGERVYITDNPNLTNLTGLSSLTTIGLQLRITDVLENDFPDFSNLINVGGLIFILNNPNVTELNFQNVTGSLSGHFWINGNTALTTLYAPETLTSIGITLSIASNPNLTTFTGFSNLIEVTQDVTFQNILATNFPDMLNLSTIGGALKIDNNSNIANLNWMQNLTSIGGSLTITNNALLSDCTINAVCNFLVGSGTRNISNNTGCCLDEPTLSSACTAGNPTPTTSPDITVQRGSTTTLTITNLPANAEALWYAEDMTTLLYQSTANNFQPTINEATTFYGTYQNVGSTCAAELVPVQILAYYPLSLRVDSYNTSCSGTNGGSAKAFVYGGAQSIGTGNFIESEERFGRASFRAQLKDFNGDGYLDVYSSNHSTSDDVWLNDGDGTFTYQTVEYNSEKASTWSTIEDYDNDGDYDIYVTNRTSTSDKVLINDGSGFFTEMPQSYGINSSQGADAGDLNGDGNIDLMVTGNSFVIVLLGNGDGTFNQQSNIGNTAYKGRSVALGDLDGDGDLDAFVANGAGLGATVFPSNPNQVYLNDGNANFTLVAEDYGTNESSWDVELGDLDGDGDLDAIFANWANNEDQIYLNDGDGTFTLSTQNFTPSFSSRGVELADFDRDGDLDMFFAHFDYYSGTGSASTSYWSNDGTGNFTQVATHREAVDVVAGDLDNDGDIDIYSCNIYAHISNGRLHNILMNDNSLVNPYSFNWSSGSSAFFDYRRANIPEGNHNLNVIDADGNSVSESYQIYADAPIALASITTDASCSVVNDGSATISVSGGAPFGLVRDLGTIGSTFESIGVLDDLDNDGDLDILAVANQVIGVNDGSGNFTDVQEPTIPTGSITDMLVGDLNGDGIKDLLSIGFYGNIGVHIGNGNLTYQLINNYSVGGTILSGQLGDLDGDGDLDLIIANAYSRPNLVFLNDGTGNFSQTSQELGSEDSWEIKLGDLDNDGDLDAMTANLGDGDIVWLNDGTGNFINHFSLPSGIASWAIELADFNNDGYLDVVVDCFGEQPSRLYFNNGDATFTLGSQMMPSLHAYDVETADIDNDGDMDILIHKTHHLGPGTWGGIIWLNDGNGYFIEHAPNFNQSYNPYFTFSRTIESGDIDGDSDIDIITVGGAGVHILRNHLPMPYTYQWSNGATTNTIPNLLPGTYTVTATDIRGCHATTTVTVGANSTASTEICDGIDNDCDGLIDEGLDITIGGTLLRSNLTTPVNNVTVNLTGVVTSSQMASGSYEFNNQTNGNNLTITPFKDDNYLECVTTHDISLILKHITGTAIITDPYALIAADVNNSGTITTLDAVQIQQLILGNSTGFNNNTSWRFVDASHTFDSSNPWNGLFPESITINSLMGCLDDANFIGIKIGDVSMCTETVNPAFVKTTASHETALINNNTLVEFSVDGFTNVSTIQFSIQWDPTVLAFDQINLNNFNPLNLNMFNFGLNDATNGIINFSWYNTSVGGVNLVQPDTSIFEVEFTALSSGQTPILITGNPVPKEVSDGNCLVYGLNSCDGSVTVCPPEICDGIDNDCDGMIDEGFDLDGDGFTSCNGDCDDNNPNIHPNADDIACNGIDEDCDGVDNIPPEATITPPNLPTSLSCEMANGYTPPNATYTNGLSGVNNISGTLTPSLANNWDNCGGTIIVTYSGQDICGRSLSIPVITINVDEAPLPTITDPNLPTSISCEMAATFSAPIANFSNGISGTCELMGTINPSVVNNWNNCGGTITVSYSGQDDCGRNISIPDIIINVDEAPLPTISSPNLPSSISCENAEAFVAPIANFSNGISGTCELMGTINPSVINNWNNCGGTITVSYSGQDDCGRNISIPDIIINVDEAPLPTISTPNLPSSISCENAEAFVAPIANFSNGISGTCELMGTINPSVVNNWNNCGGTITVSYSGQDDCGRNISIPDIVINVDEAPLPTISSPNLPSSISCENAEAFVAPIANFSNGISGTCELMGTINPSVINNWNNCGGTITVSYSGQDDCGRNISIPDIIINVDEAPLPTISSPNLPSSISCEMAATFSAPIANYSNGVLGSCELTGTIIPTVINNWDNCGGNITVTYSGQDECGRLISIPPFIINIEETPLPTMIIPSLPNSISCESASSFSAPVAAYSNGLTGSCEISGTINPIVSNNWNQFGGTIDLIYQSSDECGRNMSGLTFAISVEPAPAPTLYLPSLPSSLTCDEASIFQAPEAHYNNGMEGDCQNMGVIAPIMALTIDKCQGGVITIDYKGWDDGGNYMELPIVNIPIISTAIPTFSIPYTPSALTCSEVQNYIPPPITYTNGESGNCNISGIIEPTIEHLWNKCDGGYIFLGYEGVDECGNNFELNEVILVQEDNTPPTGTCNLSEIFIGISETIPEIEDLKVYKDNIASFYQDDCGEVIVTFLPTLEETECGTDGTFEQVYQMEISDECGNVADTCSVTISGECHPQFCTFSQQFYAYPKESHLGLSSLEIIDSLIDFGNNPIQLGMNNCSLILDDAACIQTMLNGGGTSGFFPIGMNMECTDFYENALVNQIITLILNIRYNELINPNGPLDFGSYHLEALCLLDILPGDILNQIPEDPTINDFLNHLNNYLSCQCIGNCESFETPAWKLACFLVGVNSSFNMCNGRGSCLEDFPFELVSFNLNQVENSFNLNIEGNDNNQLLLHPNPTNGKTIVRINAKSSNLNKIGVRIYGINGQLVWSNFYNGNQGINLYELNLEVLPKGVYFITVDLGDEELHNKLILH